ncbi:MAG: hypothetical protein K8S87_02590 [Planctomycetes bacterium]|nr:hypothetical protein [Planctomycetota bacterium]
MSDIDKKNQKYSPWMDNWQDNVKNPEKKTRNPKTAKTIKILIWIGFFAILVSPLALIIVSTLVKNEGIKEYKPTPFTEADAKRLMDESEAAIHLGEYFKAIHIAEYVITENADIPRIYVLACASNYFLMNYQEAIEFANEALKLNPNYNAARYLIAMCLNKIDSGVGENSIAVNLQPNNYPYSYYFGSLYKELIGDYEEMLNFSQKGVVLDDKSPLMLFGHAKALFANSQFKKALDTIEMIMSRCNFTQFSTKAIWNRVEILKAEILMKFGENEDAELILSRNYKNYPNWWELVRVYAEFSIANENYKEAVQILEKYSNPKRVVNQKFDVIEMYRLRGFAKLMNGQLPEAFVDYMNIIKIETGIENIVDIEIIKEFLTPACHAALLGLTQVEFKRDAIVKARKYMKYIDSAYLNLDETAIFDKLSKK